MASSLWDSEGPWGDAAQGQDTLVPLNHMGTVHVNQNQVWTLTKFELEMRQRVRP